MKNNKDLDLCKLSRYHVFWTKADKKTKSDVVEELTSFGFKEVPTCNGGDDDFVVVDYKRNEWAFWEYGFSPFSQPKENFPKDKDLAYWYENSK